MFCLFRLFCFRLFRVLHQQNNKYACRYTQKRDSKLTDGTFVCPLEIVLESYRNFAIRPRLSSEVASNDLTYTEVFCSRSSNICYSLTYFIFGIFIITITAALTSPGNGASDHSLAYHPTHHIIAALTRPSPIPIGGGRGQVAPRRPTLYPST